MNNAFRRLSLLLLLAAPGIVTAQTTTRIEVPSGAWVLVGDLVMPTSSEPLPAVLLLNKADGDRTIYHTLATVLAERGIASLRLDLRGHGESTNIKAFVPGELRRDPLIWDAEVDVIAAHQYLTDHPRIDAQRIGIVGASYSGEEMAEAGRMHGYGQAYVVLSPGSFSEASVQGVDDSGVPWLYITSQEDPFLTDITALLQAHSETVEMVLLPGRSHATNLLEAHPELAERIAVWLTHKLR